MPLPLHGAASWVLVPGGCVDPAAQKGEAACASPRIHLLLRMERRTGMDDNMQPSDLPCVVFVVNCLCCADVQYWQYFVWKNIAWRSKKWFGKARIMFTPPVECVRLSSWNPMMMSSLVCTDNCVSWKQIPYTSVWNVQVGLSRSWQKNQLLCHLLMLRSKHIVQWMEHLINRSARFQKVAPIPLKGQPLTSKRELFQLQSHDGRLMRWLRKLKTEFWWNTVGHRWHTHLCSVSILTGAIQDSSASTGCQQSTGPQALAQVLNGARFSSAWKDNRKPGAWM